MARPLKQLESEILGLPVKERARLVRLILVSLEEDEPTEDSEEVERAWAEEIERRVAEVRSGDIELVPGEDVFKEAEDLTG